MTEGSQGLFDYISHRQDSEHKRSLRKAHMTLQNDIFVLGRYAQPTHLRMTEQSSCGSVFQNDIEILNKLKTQKSYCSQVLQI